MPPIFQLLTHLVLTVTPDDFQRRLCDDGSLQDQFGEQSAPRQQMLLSSAHLGEEIQHQKTVSLPNMKFGVDHNSKYIKIYIYF